MRFLVFLPLISLLRSTVANALLGDVNDANLFGDHSGSLFTDDLAGLSTDDLGSTRDQALLTDDENSNIFDGWPTDFDELAGVDDFCRADGEIQTVNRMRTRDEHPSSCSSSGQNFNQLQLPNLLDIFNKKPSVNPGSKRRKSHRSLQRQRRKKTNARQVSLIISVVSSLRPTR